MTCEEDAALIGDVRIIIPIRIVASKS